MPSALFIKVEKEQVDGKLKHKKATLTELSLLLTQIKIMEKQIISSIEKTMETIENSQE